MSVFDASGKELTNGKIRVCGLNVGNFANGESGTPAGTDELYNKFVNTFRMCNADVYMFSEWDVYWNGSVTSESIFGFLKPYRSVYCKSITGGATGQMNYSNYPITAEYYEDYTQMSSYYFIDNTISVNGKDIHFICTHFTLESKADALSQMQQLIDYISDNEITNYIIGGDMNLGLHAHDDIPQTIENRISIALEEIALLESLGGKSIQGSGWGLKQYNYLFNTVLHSGYEPATGRGIGPYDNFIISPSIRLLNVELVITEASDHDALCVDLII